MGLALPTSAHSPEDLGHAQPRTETQNGVCDTRARSTRLPRKHIVDLDADIPLGPSNKSHIAGDQVKAESITDVETSRGLLSVRDDIISEIRNLKVVLLKEVQVARNHAAYIPTTSASASPPSQFAALPIAERIVDTQENEKVKLSHMFGSDTFEQRQGSFETMQGTLDSRQETFKFDQCSQGDHSSSLRRSSIRSSCGSSKASFASKVTRKSTARLYDEAILEDLRHQRRTFAHPDRISCEDIKNNVRKSYASRVVSDLELYSHTGLCQKVARHYLFEFVTLAVIVLNAIWMSVDADLSGGESINKTPLPYLLTDAMFYAYFVGEILVRFLAFRRKARFYEDRWFVFDLVLVILYTLDPFVFAIIQDANGEDNGGGMDLTAESLRLVRLVRLFRLTRLLRNFPEMVIIVKGIATALATVGYTIGLLALITYVFAIALRNTVPGHSEIESHYFPTILETMHHLFLHGAFLDNLSKFILDVKSGSTVCFMLSWLYIFLAHLLIMNVLIGILCEVMAAVAADADENFVVNRINDTFLKLLSENDDNDEGRVGWEEFAEFLEGGSCQAALRKFDVDVDVLVDMVEDQFFCSDFNGEAITISFTQIIDLIVDLRGSKTASVKDVMVIGRRINTKFRELKEHFETVAMSIRGGSRTFI